jgi:hypothetical protein
MVGADLRAARRETGRHLGTGRLGDPALPTLQSDLSAFHYAKQIPDEKEKAISALASISHARTTCGQLSRMRSSFAVARFQIAGGRFRRVRQLTAQQYLYMGDAPVSLYIHTSGS